TYLVRKEDSLLAEEKQQAAFDKKLAQEEEWIRRRVKARRTRDMGRVARLKDMRSERSARRQVSGTATLKLAEAGRSGVKVIDADKLNFRYPNGPVLVRDFTTILTRGDKIGLIGPNGAGKTTFIRLLLGELAPTGGTLKHGTQLEVLYFDQMRSQINGDLTVAENIADGNETVTVNGRTRHVISYLQDFLFEPDRARTPARVLSGGERNRLLLARLFTKPANVLVMDEPTNDLDAETLDLLEDLLVDYQGTLLVVSHDRDFLDNVVTSTLVFEGDGRIGEYIGGYSDWVAEKEKQVAAKANAAGVGLPAVALAKKGDPGAPAPKPRKLTNRERRELEALPARIEALENEQAELGIKLSDPEFYKNEAAQFVVVKTRLDAIEAEHARAFARWEELEALSGLAQ
ncbi:MAG: ATP-binding cassette domain-containing protein, partial [Cephaloticoccus sp.]|nr:ATP-binding cassette domain-containing protein [Cephaloticoccus sp.]